MRSIGLHLRLTTTITDLFERSRSMGMSTMQCFLVDKAGTLLKLDASEINQCLLQCADHMKNRFVHASYWTNLSGVSSIGRHVLLKEMELAKRLEFTHMVVHPGSAKGVRKRSDGIDLLARSLNKILKQEQSMTIVLENVAHGNMTIGGDLNDFKTLLQKLDKPEALKFCIDTAHAHSYGYDLAHESGQDKFIELLSHTVGLERIALIHLNDTHEKVGSRMDRHAAPGCGTIGLEALKRFALHPNLSHLPMIIELPIMQPEAEVALLQNIQTWEGE